MLGQGTTSVGAGCYQCWGRVLPVLGQGATSVGARWLKYKNWLGIFGGNSGNICPAWASQFNTFYSQFQKYKFSKFTAYDRQAFETHD